MVQFMAQDRRITSSATTANPGPLGLCGFALTTFVLSSINAGWFPAGSTGIVVGLALFYGGIAQFMAGMWEFKAGNTFGATAFASFGAFWLSYAVIFIPATGILASLSASKSVEPAVGIYLLAWTMFTFLMFLGTFRINVALVILFGILTLTFLALTLGTLWGAPVFTQTGGYLGVVTACVAWYTALAGVLSAHNGIKLPIGPMS